MILFGCETTKILSSMQSNNTEPPRTIRNTKCEDVKSFKVFQVLDNFVLANVCRDGDDEYCFGHVVYIQKEKNKIYFDDQKINLRRDECAIYIGTYKYEAKNGLLKTVPKVKIISSQVPNPEYDERLKNKKIN